MSDEKQSPENMHGQLIGYRIEYLNEDKIWKEAKFKKSPDGVPFPLFDRYWLHASGLLGYEQAMTLLWYKMAEQAADRLFATTKLRLVPYKVTYSLEWQKDESQAIEPFDTIENIRELNTLREAMGIKP